MSQIRSFVAYKGFSVTPSIGAAEGDGMVSAASPRWMQSRSQAQPAEPVVNANQMTSLNAMIAYSAAQAGQSEFGIERNLSDHFNIPNAKCLPAAQFDSAIRYLVENLPG